MRYRLRSALKIINKGERGTVLPLVLIALLLMGLMIPPLMGLISTSLVTGQMYENNSYELYAADAGVMDAMWLIQSYADPELNYITPEGVTALFDKDQDGTDEPYTDGLLEEINGKTVTYQIVRDGLGFIITSTATETDGSTTTIETRVEFPPPPPPVYMAAAALNGDMKLNAEMGSAAEKISIYANGNIDMVGSGDVYADVYHTAGHTVDLPDSGTFVGSIRETTPLVVVSDFLPPDPEESAENMSLYQNNGIGDVTIRTSQTLGPIFIDGNLTIETLYGEEDPVVELTGTVWVTGKILIDDGAVVKGRDTDDNPYFMVSTWDKTGRAISVTGYADVEAFLYAEQGYVHVGGNTSLHGSAVGAVLDVLGSCSLTSSLPFEPMIPEYQSMDINYWKIS